MYSLGMQALGAPNAFICSISRIRDRSKDGSVSAYWHIALGTSTCTACHKTGNEVRGRARSRGTYGGVHNHDQHGTPILPPRAVNARSLRPKDPLWYGEPKAFSQVVSYAKLFRRSHDAVIRVFDIADNAIPETQSAFRRCAR